MVGGEREREREREREESNTLEKVRVMSCSPQMEVGKSKGCGRNCLSRCCLRRQGARFPLYVFSKTAKDANESLVDAKLQLSFVDRLLEQWDNRMQRGFFHYDITSYERKVIPGEYGFVTQLIEGRDSKKRPTEYRVDKVLQPFDESKFNFTKIGQEEALFRFEGSENDKAEYFHDAPIYESDSLNVIVINVSPIGYGHVLLVPHILDLLPQRIDQESVLLALYLSKEAGNPYFKVGYNSLGAFATINHCHFQAFYLSMLLPVEKAATEAVASLRKGVRVLRLPSYPVKGLVFEIDGDGTIQDLANAASKACIVLQNSEQPFNVLICESGKRVFLFMQCYAEKRSLGEVTQEVLDNLVSPAVWEISGYMVLKRRKDYDEASEDTIIDFLSLVSVSEESFQQLQAKILDDLKQGEC